MRAPVLPEITGHTRVFAILADPVAHVRTPQAINAHLARIGFDGVLVPMQVSAGDLAQVVAAMRRVKNFGGFIVTVPHKTAVAALIDDMPASARAIGAVNCVRREEDGRLVGAMLDGVGFVDALRKHGHAPRGMSVYLAGAGGAANAIAFALAEAGASRLSIANRTRAKSDDLASRLKTLYPRLAVDTAPASPAAHDLVVNATSLGLKPGDPLPLDVEALAPTQLVADIIMQPEVTPLLAAARERGCSTQGGHPMLLAQIEAMAAHLGARA